MLPRDKGLKPSFPYPNTMNSVKHGLLLALSLKYFWNPSTLSFHLHGPFPSLRQGNLPGQHPSHSSTWLCLATIHSLSVRWTEATF